MAEIGPHPKDPSRHIHCLVPDHAAAPIVGLIFEWYTTDRWSCGQIARKLTEQGVPCPSAHDPERNRHRRRDKWNASTVTAILANPRYTGRQVWQRTRGTEQMVDEDDVEAGYRKVYAHVDPAEWVWSESRTHEPLVSDVVWAKAQGELSLGRGPRGAERVQVARRTYPLSGLVWCSCGRRMEADTYRGHGRYRCAGQRRDADHPPRAWVREDRVLEPLDKWIGTLFDPEHVDGTIETMLNTPDDPAVEARRADAETRIAECDRKLARYRRALDAGVDEVVIGGWITDVRADRAQAERMLAECATDQPTDAEVKAMAVWFSACAERFTAMLERIDPERRKALYQTLGVRLIVNPGSDQVEVTLHPDRGGYPVSEGGQVL